jgi:hypothetical protein
MMFPGQLIKTTSTLLLRKTNSISSYSGGAGDVTQSASTPTQGHPQTPQQQQHQHGIVSRPSFTGSLLPSMFGSRTNVHTPSETTATNKTGVYVPRTTAKRKFFRDQQTKANSIVSKSKLPHITAIMLVDEVSLSFYQCCVGVSNSLSFSLSLSLSLSLLLH